MLKTFIISFLVILLIAGVALLIWTIVDAHQRQRNNQPRRKYWFACLLERCMWTMIFILLAYSLLSSILCCFSMRRCWSKSKVEAALQRSGRRVIGRVVGQSFSMLSWDIIYSYHYQGQDYQNTRSVLVWNLYPKQDAVTVLFLADNPQIALAQIHHSPGESTIAGLCALLYLTMAMISFFLLLRFYLL